MCISDEVYNLKESLLKDKIFFHSNPELGYKEIKTSSYISYRLKELGFEVQDNVAKTGVVGLLKGNINGPCILFRADMDAILTNSDDLTSVKHVCGHDSHMSILLGLASLISKNKALLRGTAKLVFQPCEEGWGESEAMILGGAEAMIEEGVLETPIVNKAFALHVWSELPEGSIGVQGGAVMASGDEFEIEVYGKGGHAALPEKCVDPIYIASQIVLSLQSIISRNISAVDTAVLSVTCFNGGCNYNTICEKVSIKGTCRTYKDELRKFIASRLEKLVISITEGFGGKAIVKYGFKHPPVMNCESEANLITGISEGIVGKENVIKNYRTMCTEDFSHFLQKVPGALIFIGCQGEKYYPQHSLEFSVGEKPMLVGLELLYGIAKAYLIE